jgi:hypothetical protein
VTERYEGPYKLIRSVFIEKARPALLVKINKAAIQYVHLETVLMKQLLSNVNFSIFLCFYLNRIAPYGGKAWQYSVNGKFWV